MKKSIIIRWLHNTAMLNASIIAFSGAVFGQANYLSICNPTGVCSSCCGNYTNTFNCKSSPYSGSFTAIPSINPDVLNIYGSSYYQNAVYDNAGAVLFYVDYGGIYDPTGNGLFAFSTPETYTVTGCFGGTQTYTDDLGNAGSEIVTFPVPGGCNAYYVVFWCGTSTTYTIGGVTINTAVLRVVEVDLTADFGNTTVTTSAWYNITDNVLDAPVCNNQNFVRYQGYPWENFAVAADAENTDGSRDVYTVNPLWGGRTNDNILSKFHFPADGSLPTFLAASMPVIVDPVPYVFGAKANVINLSRCLVAC